MIGPGQEPAYIYILWGFTGTQQRVVGTSDDIEKLKRIAADIASLKWRNREATGIPPSRSQYVLTTFGRQYDSFCIECRELE